MVDEMIFGRFLALIALIVAVLILSYPASDSLPFWCGVAVLGFCGGTIGLVIKAEWREWRRSDSHEENE
jgi:hypothetical protein